MSLIRKMTGLGSGIALAALVFGALAATASAQEPPFTAYGQGLEQGDTVAASVGGEECGSTTADADGNWILQISGSDPCSPQAGDEITFTLNGDATTATETFQAGGAPADVANGIDLEVDDDGGAAPPPSETGNAGLLGSNATSPLLAIALGVLAITFVAGARKATSRR